MKTYAVSLALGLLVGLIYALFNVRSPAPPVIALVGLLGILLGEQIPPLFRQVFKPETAATSWLHHQVKPHMFGELPRNTAATSNNSNITKSGENTHG